MNFNSVSYMIFLPLAAILYFVIPQKLKNIYLLFISYYFYFCNEARFFLILPVLTLITYIFALAIGRRQGKGRRALFWLALGANLGTLIFFKYNKFFISAFAGLFLKESFVFSSLILPMGISFYVFMAVSYLVDVFLKKYPREENFVKFAVYISFFPHVLMGPIDRANKFLPQLDKPHSFEYSRVRKALILMGIGFFKKIAVADILAKFINRVHTDLYSYSGLILIFTAFIYSFQLYADFSGYSDIARASAMILDFDIAENFNTPYLATNFSRFWSRWHISLSSWFQDYIFTPFVWTNPLKKIFGEKLFSSAPVIPRIALVFICSGIWHGNTWNFVIWGVCHALFRVGEELLHKYYKKRDKHPKPLKYWSKVLGVFTLVTFSQIFFRCKDIPAAIYYIKNLFADLSPRAFFSRLTDSIAAGFDATPLLIYAYMAFCLMGLILLIYMDCYRCFKLKGKCLTTAFDNMKPAKRWLCYYVMIAFIMAGFIMNNGGFGASASFIYNNF